MDILDSLFKLAEDRRLLHCLDNGRVMPRLSIYVDDVVLFIKPQERDLRCTKIVSFKLELNKPRKPNPFYQHVAYVTLESACWSKK
jgi:hypothetical protein